MVYLIILLGVVLLGSLLLSGVGGFPLVLTALVMVAAAFVMARLGRNRPSMRH